MLEASYTPGAGRACSLERERDDWARPAEMKREAVQQRERRQLGRKSGVSAEVKPALRWW